MYELLLHPYHCQHIWAVHDYERRKAEILHKKPANEHQERLKWMQRVSDDIVAQMPDEFVRASETFAAACEKFDEAWEKFHKADETLKKDYEAWKKAGEAWDKSYVDWKQTYAKHEPALEALHKQVFPDCPWNGRRLIFQ